MSLKNIFMMPMISQVTGFIKLHHSTLVSDSDLGSIKKQLRLK